MRPFLKGVAAILLGLVQVHAACAVEAGQPSRTALVTLALRALGTGLPEEAVRNPDTLAAAFLGERERELLRQMPGTEKWVGMSFPEAWSGMPEIYRRVFLHVLARTRMIDEALADAVADGARQVVILGAGYDTRAYRLKALLQNVTVFELDLPSPQDYKKERVREVLKALPDNVVYVPIDFAAEDLAETLLKSGFRSDQKTFFVWEGVTMYIPELAVAQTLDFVASRSAPGSRIVFDYEHQNAINGGNDDDVLKASNARLAKIGEPHIFGFPDGSARNYVVPHGFSILADLTPEEVTTRYLTRPDGTRLGDARWSNGICLAEVMKRSRS